MNLTFSSLEVEGAIIIATFAKQKNLTSFIKTVTFQKNEGQICLKHENTIKYSDMN